MSDLTYRRVGHKGADHIAPGNTLASFDAALEAGVDMVEFDVLRTADGRLVLAHDLEDAQRPGVLTLDEGLDHLVTDAYAGIELDVDLKRAGYEREVIDALRARGLVDRTLISTMEEESLPIVRELEPGVRLGWSVPKLTRDPFRSRAAMLPAYLALQVYRRVLPRQAASAIRQHVADALMTQWRLVTPALVRAVQRAGGEIYVWTVDEPALIERFTALGVDGIITNDPRLFQPEGDADSSSQTAAL
jgi:glycerophosphoryl diester phosphodiesterase